MKKILTLLFVFGYLFIQAQTYTTSPAGIVRIKNNTTAFGHNIPTGFNVVDLTTYKQYLVINSLGLAGTQSITSSTYGLREITNTDITPYSPSANTGFTLNASTYINAKVSTNVNITITISNLSEGMTGNIEVYYTGTAIVTFAIPSYTPVTNIYITSGIFGGSYSALVKWVISRPAGMAVYSYYRSGANCYITGTQIWN